MKKMEAKRLFRRSCLFALTSVLLVTVSSVAANAAQPSAAQSAQTSASRILRGLFEENYGSKTPATNAELYKAAVVDSMTIEDEEVLPLIEITKDSAMCSWDASGRVLMLTFHSYPDSYVAGSEYVLKYGEVWTFTDKEIVKWYDESKQGVSDWPLRFKQLIGLPEEREYTHFSGMWVDPADITRPAYKWALSDTTGANGFASEPSAEFKAWFDGNIVWSYFDSAYPWTRLGYTYDWAADGDEYGLSEFIVRKDAVTSVEFTMTTEEFVKWLEDQ